MVSHLSKVEYLKNLNTSKAENPSDVNQKLKNKMNENINTLAILYFHKNNSIKNVNLHEEASPS